MYTRNAEFTVCVPFRFILLGEPTGSDRSVVLCWRRSCNLFTSPTFVFEFLTFYVSILSIFNLKNVFLVIILTLKGTFREQLTDTVNRLTLAN